MISDSYGRPYRYGGTRIREHMEIPNPFLQDIRTLFEEEYTAAKNGVEILKNLTDLEFSEDEIGYITLHLHAGLAKENVAQSLETARLVNRCLGLIEEYMNKKLTADSLGYNRLVSHIRYMLARVRKGESANLDLEDYARHSFPREYEAAAKVCQILEQEMKLHFPQEETGFLAIPYRRVWGHRKRKVKRMSANRHCIWQQVLNFLGLNVPSRIDRSIVNKNRSIYKKTVQYFSY